MICKYFNLYNDSSMCYKVQIDVNPRKNFSNKMIDFIFNELSKDNKLVDHIKQKTKKS